ncbi:The BTB (BR-C, ttk and bab)/POZ (Pox virus and Zinc finger) domain [Rhizoctonia solani]|uniref:The BTB (BR-C, ttk and bab)/POZ (Pox virus and Zinc finger) domain n=1 Tax=Rhizoctonia solani TaxID=456999 RepID=A0A8H8P7Y4_9AGAM|nr:The BTB (BR-C, ttk and bab)/POZ (Pox virus and Zinc finger) domain [Rhizoctonia solani]QRW26935.1 The BTB (BR-C, ttk and bab)/POZ (Pox virus and Zinc finger) domain [Rhizoctonia solani]
MFYGATKPDPIELAEDAESISLMLAFIYPVAPPHINTIDHLEKIMKVSQKYDVERMTKFIEEAVTLGSKLMTLDPMRVFYLCLAKYFPQAAPVIGLVGAQGARVKILDQVLIWSPQEYGCYQLSALGDDKNHGAALPVCPSHAPQPRNQAMGLDPESQERVLPVCQTIALFGFASSTMNCWRNQCMNATICFVLLASRTSALKCIGCVAVTIGKKDIFEQWALNVKQIVRNELEVLDPLYSL